MAAAIRARIGSASSWWRYSVAVVATVVTLAICYYLTDIVGHEFPFILLTLPVMISSYIGGLGPGLLATALVTALGAYFILEPHFSLKLTNPSDHLRLAITAIVGVSISFLSEALHRARRHSASMLESITDSYFALDGDWRIIEMNERAGVYLGIHPADVIGKPFWQVCSQCRDSPLELRVNQVIASDTPAHFEMPSCGFPGRWAEFHAYPSRDCVAVYFRDISERKRYEEALRLSEDRLRLATEAADVGVWEWDLRDNRVTVSNKAKAILGFNPDDTITYDKFLGRLHPEDREKTEQALKQALAERRDYQAEYRVVWPDGSEHWLLARGRVFHDDEGTPARMYGIAVDITQRKLAEARLQSAKEAAEGANRAKDDFLAALSHELRNPLTPVLMTAESLAADKNLPQPVRQDLEMIGRNVEIEKRLIDDLLDLTRIARGKLLLKMQAADAHQTILHALESVRAELDRKNLQLQLHLDAFQHHVSADPTRLQQIFWNLLTNAVKFTPPGGSVTVRTRNPEPADSNNRIQFEFMDTGIGIEPDVLPRIFDAFEQTNADVTRRFGGLGLGLAISKALVELHHGSISVHSTGHGCGATFTVELPTVPAPAAQPSGPSPPSNAEKRKMRILLVEDHESTAQVLARLLGAMGHETRIADSVASALDLSAREPFDMVISDLGLPDGSGLDLMRQLRQRHLPGIALSGYGMEEDVRKSLDAGFAEHLVKPVNLRLLEDTVARFAEALPV